MSTLFCRRFTLIWSSLHSVREILLTLLAKMDVESDDIDNTGLVVTEYLTNLIRHSAAEDEAVTLVIERTMDAIEIKLVDPTDYFHPTLSQHSKATITDGELREGGMGLALIAHYFPGFRYYEQGGNNHFCFSLALKKVRNRIVIIDDEQASLELLKAYLQRDYECHAFSDELQAYEYLMAHQVDLLLIDMNLNRMLADEFISHIKQFEHLTDIGIVVISADGSRETMLKAHLCGVDDYLVKPVTKTQLDVVCERVKSRCVSRVVNMPRNDSEALNSCFSVGQLSVNAFGNIATGRGGDFLLTIKNNQRHYLFFGDVMGHGEMAHRIALQLKGFIHGMSQAAINSIDELVNALHTSLTAQSFMQRNLVTFIAMEISQRYISLINAGHPLPVLLQKDQTIKSLGSSQPLLGLNRHHQYTSKCYQLAQGESLVMATDGIFESHGNCSELQQLVNSLKSIETILPARDMSQLWCKCLPKLSKEIDDSSLLVLN